MSTQLMRGDALALLRSGVEPASINMIYCDPPFGTEREWSGSAGSFSDKWHPDARSEAAWAELIAARPGAHALIRALPLGEKQHAYLGFAAALLLGCHRVLKPTGTLWLHFDDTSGAYLRLLGAMVFGVDAELGTLVWRRTHGVPSSRRKDYARVCDTIACWGRSPAAAWRLWRIGTLGGDPLSPRWSPRFDGFAAAAPLGSAENERVGYPTQKPIALLEELISAATLCDDLVLDPTCGSGTTLVAARGLGRRSIGIDVSSDAIAAAKFRLDAFTGRQRDLFDAAAA